MSIIHTYDIQTEAVINPSQIAPAIEGFPDVAIVTFDERVIKALKAHYRPKTIDEMIACVRIPIYQIHYKQKKFAVYGSTLGGPATAGLMEEMISKGCKKFVFFGSCGVLDRSLATKSLIIPTCAYRDEGTSYHYAAPSEYMDVPTAPKLSWILTECKIPHICGKTWTTDAFYRETRGNMKKRKSEGCITVEMECASIMSVAQFRGIEAYQFF